MPNRLCGKHEEGPQTAVKSTETQMAEIEEKEAQLQKEAQRHKRHLNLEREKKDNNTFHNDEAFERFEMGDQQKGHTGGFEGNRITAIYDTVKRNHHARGGAKEKTLKKMRASQPRFEEDFDSLESINRK